MIETDLAFTSATELAQLVRERKVSPVELVRMYLERIDRWDDRLHAYVTVSREAAIQHAKEAEAAVTRGDRLGPLHGVPIAVKDQFLTKGIRTTNGTRALADFVPDVDAAAITRLREAGAILLGKLNMPEGGMLGTRDWPYGQPRNPWNMDHEAGASSTGGGIAAAAALCAAALGEDTGGSIRNPASYCGVVGMRPTWGRASRHGLLPIVWSMDTAGPMTRTVADSALIMRTIAGHDPRDVFTARLPVPDYVAALDGEAAGLRVGIIREYFESGLLDQETGDAVRAAAAVLGRLGARVEEVSVPMILLAGVIFCAIADSGSAVQHRRELLEDPDLLDAGPRRRMLAASLLPVSLYYKVEQARNLMRDQIRAALEHFDVLICPSAPGPAGRIDRAQVATWTTEDLIKFWQRGSHTSPFSLAAVPALSMPCGYTALGLPIGMQIVGRPFAEGTVLRAAHAYESNSDAHMKRPPLS
jgi:aspartyl-tRNA(Asn)/glutamyl-tRNA(Gln) amidotransferase subunit A